MVEGCKAAGDMERLAEARGYGRAEPDVTRHHTQRGQQRHRLEAVDERRMVAGSITTASEMKNRSNFPRSAISATDFITGRLQLVANAPSYRHPAEWLPVPSTNTPRCI